MLHAAPTDLIQDKFVSVSDRMCRYVGIVLYDGLVEEALTFENQTKAISWVTRRRSVYGTEETSGSLAWDAERQLPVGPTDNSG